MPLIASLPLLMSDLPPPPPQPTVLVLHGLGRTSCSMQLVARDLRKAGYRVVCETYPSRRWPVERIAEEWLAPRIEQARRDGGPVHFVTHSMGGIVVRAYLERHGAEGLGRMVMLAPPNRGSELSDHLRRFAPARWWNGPAMLQLGTDEGSLPNRMGAPAIPCGVLAGSVSLNPLFSRMVRGASDGKVSVERTHVQGESDHQVHPFSHTWLMNRQPVRRAILGFLRDGRFPPLEG